MRPDRPNISPRCTIRHCMHRKKKSGSDTIFFSFTFALYTYFFRHVKEWASQSKGCFLANKRLPKLTIWAYLGAKIVERCIKVVPATSWSCSGPIDQSHGLEISMRSLLSRKQWKLDLVKISVLSARASRTLVHRIHRGNTHVTDGRKEVIEYRRCDRWRSVKHKRQYDPPAQSIRKWEGDSAPSNYVRRKKRFNPAPCRVSGTEATAVFSLGDDRSHWETRWDTT